MNDLVPQTLKGMPSRFDYALLSQENVLYVKRKAQEIHKLINKRRGRGRIYGRDVFPIGAILLDVNSKMPDHLFNAWYESETELTVPMVDRYMKVTKELGRKASKLGHVLYSVLYELTLPGCPQSFIDEIEAGTRIPSAKEIHEARMAIVGKIEITPDFPKRVTLQDLSSQMNLMQQKIQEMERSAIPLEIEQQIADLQRELQSITDINSTLTRELDIANDALLGRDKEIERLNDTLLERDNKIEELQKSFENLSKERQHLLDRYRKDSDKLNRIVMTVQQACKEN